MASCEDPVAAEDDQNVACLDYHIVAGEADPSAAAAADVVNNTVTESWVPSERGLESPYQVGRHPEP
jgi:hypothetical protein